MERVLNMIDLEQITTRIVTQIPSVLAAIFVLLVFWMIFRVTQRPLRGLLRRGGFQDVLIHMLVNNVYRIVVLLFGVVMAADQIGINVGAALAGLGVAGIAVGFAAQDSLANTIAGFMIFWDKPFKVKDWVTVAGQYGSISHITMRTTRIRTNSNTYVIIPNRKIIDEILVNHSKHGETRLEIPVGIAYKESIPEARRVILEAVKGLKGTAAEPAPDVVATQLDNSSVNLLVRIWIQDAAVEQPVFYRVLEASKIALDEAGIQIPFPHLQLFVDDVQDRVWDGLRRVREQA